MYTIISLVTLLYLASIAQTFELPSIKSATANTRRALNELANVVGSAVSLQPRTKSCPPVWSEISTTLTEQFLADGQCTDAARAAIRAAFHDWYVFVTPSNLYRTMLIVSSFNGACDGSLILANECSNSENAGLSRLCGNLGNLAQEKGVGVADLIQFAAGKDSEAHTNEIVTDTKPSPRHQNLPGRSNSPCKSRPQGF